MLYGTEFLIYMCPHGTHACLLFHRFIFSIAYCVCVGNIYEGELFYIETCAQFNKCVRM